MKDARIREIRRILINKKLVSNKELCDAFGVSIETIRRDLDTLESEGFIRKVYGGASLLESPHATDRIEEWDTRLHKNDTDKKNIAEQIAPMIPDGCTVFLDNGTSIFELVPLLRNKKNLSVLTSSLRIASELANYDNISVYIIGGMVNRSTVSSGGYFARDFLSAFYRIDYAVISCDGFLPEYGTVEYSSEVSEVKSVAIGKAEHVFTAVDHSKFGISGSCLCCPLEKIDVLVTDALAPRNALATLREQGVNVIIAGSDDHK